MTQNDLKQQMRITILAIEKAKFELCVLNELIEEELRHHRLKGTAGEKAGNALTRGKKTIDKAFEGFSGFPGIEVDLRQGGFS